MAKYIAFGDSFVNIFYALQSKNFIIKKFKGALIQGLVKHNENYESILNNLDNNHYDYGFFVFGNVDLSFYFYKKKYIDKVSDKEIIDTIFNNAEKYVKLINDLKNIKNKFIINIFPSTISDKNYIKILIKYGIIPEDIEKNINKINIKYSIRNKRIIDFNNLLDKYCSIYNVKFCNIYDIIVNKRKYLDNIFKLQHNELNIHFNNEYILVVFISTCLSFLWDNKVIKNPLYNYDDLLKIIKKTSDDYVNRLSNRNKKEYNKNRFDIIKITTFIKNKLIELSKKNI
jgi:hypothetical protein